MGMFQVNIQGENFISELAKHLKEQMLPELRKQVAEDFIAQQNEKVFLTVKEAAKEVSVNVGTVYNWIENDQIELNAYRVNKVTRVKRSELLAIFKSINDRY